ncbi:Uma2 family endonuclease [Thiocapsa rosea]|uniref:Putative restriction endonuclease n=1 Tax=Thiocapsa rosea TaxID=69360 RepID=A0A495V6M1_9GAMM|nr:Uma2 family endonuclease [Thiocapsa rosea]RKT44924.1 putative restriction endonuclease [Thiocapsa rosea]
MIALAEVDVTMSTRAAARAEQHTPTTETDSVQPVSQAGRLVTEEEYWRDYYFESDIHYEWNNGRLEEKPVSDYGTYLVYAWFTLLLQHFLRARPIAKMVALEMGFRLPLPTGTVIRKPDFGVVRNDNPQPLLYFDASYHGVFDLCVEALSERKPAGIVRDTVTKKAEYAAGGVKEYIILHREPERQAFYTLTTAGVYVPIAPEEGVIHSRVLPGLGFRLDDLIAQPSLEEMRRDPVYAAFVLPGWREAEERAEAEARRAESESQARMALEQRLDEEIRARQEAEEALAQLRAQRPGR